MGFDLSRRARLVGALLLCAASACSTELRRFPAKGPLWDDPDRRPFPGPPEEYFSPFGWDAANQTIFRPISRAFAVDPAGEAVNVNAWDEVPNSSWFENRLGRRALSPEDIAEGPCRTPAPGSSGPWTVTGAKPNGANPGFIIKTEDGRRYLLKFDGIDQGPRATTADVVVSRIYHAAGFFVPCNRVAYFDASILRIDPEAEAEDDHGDDVPLEQHHVDAVLSKALRTPDGRYRASASLFIDGRPIGPFTYQGVRDDDPNDIVPHEDRRELRGSRLLAAWTNHFDAREQNTLAAFVETSKGRGHVRHYIIDFGDCFGSVWEPPMLGRRIGHSYYLDFSYMAEDFLTLGVVTRPWDVARFGPTGPVLGYYEAELFEPEPWRPGYPNPAFSRMSERDAAWMARIIARFSDAHLETLIDTASLADEALRRVLFEVLRRRRDEILKRYLDRLSPLAHPRIALFASRADARGAPPARWVCLEDLAVSSGISAANDRLYAARAFRGAPLEPAGQRPIRRPKPNEVCVELPRAFSIRATSSASLDAPERAYVVVDVWAGTRSHESFPLRVHLYGHGVAADAPALLDEYSVVGLERPDERNPATR
jgi:hypothetical protein